MSVITWSATVLFGLILGFGLAYGHEMRPGESIPHFLKRLFTEPPEEDSE